MFFLFQFIDALLEHGDEGGVGVSGLVLRIGLRLVLLLDEQLKFGFEGVNLLITGDNIALELGDGVFDLSAIPERLHGWSGVAVVGGG